MPERFRGELLTMGRYTNPASFNFFAFNNFPKQKAYFVDDVNRFLRNSTRCT